MLQIFLISAVLLVLGGILYGLHLAGLKKKVAKAWLDVYEIFQRRQDLLPIVVEMAKKDMPDANFPALIHARQSASHAHLPDRHKIEQEHHLKQAIDQFLFAAAKSSALQKNLYFLEIQRDLENVEKEIGEAMIRYNDEVRNYNKTSTGLFAQPVFHL